MNLNYYNNLNVIMNIAYINNRIRKEVCIETIHKLEDISMIAEYKKFPSVKNKISHLEKILENHKIDQFKIKLIIDEYLPSLIPPGTKAVCRGNMFNSYVKDTITNIKLDKTRFKVRFEKHCSICPTPERPDWYIYDKLSKKVLTGFNQLDFWRGGQQSNRGSNYILNNPINTDKSRLLCVICNSKEFVNDKTKAYKLFQIGYTNDTLCYIKNIENIINKYFNQ
jgi:hypothetical protein